MVMDGSVVALPAGVSLYALTPHCDARGSVVEIYRETWDLGCRPVQFNALTSAAGVLRGVHVHVRHVDHLVLLSGRAVVGLHDMRPVSPTAGASCLLDLDAHEPRAVIVPPGVAHGLYFPVASVLTYGLSLQWEPGEEIGCRWDCKELGLAWPTSGPLLSERDAAAPGYAESFAAFGQAWAAQYGTAADR